ncbi:hypothetical protein NBRC116592_34430 [Colwellia sp. KU-HH00111]
MYLKESFCIGDILFNPERNAIIVNKQEKRIKPKTMLLMCYLAKNSDRVVTKEDIMTNLWQGVVVGDEAVTRLIFNLRNVLCDDAKNPKFIETIPTKGYRLLVAPDVIKTKVDGRKYKFLVLAFVMSLVITSLMSLFINKNELYTGTISEVASVTNKAGLERHFNINFKTNNLLYVHVTNSSSQLFFKLKGEGVPIQLTDSHSRKRSPKWLNEDTFLYIQARRNDYAITRQNLAGKQEDLYSTQNFIYWVNQTKQKLFFTEESSSKGQRKTSLKSLDLVTGKVDNLSENNSELPDYISSFAVDLSGNRLFVSDQSGQLMLFELGSKQLHPLQSNFTRVLHIDVINEHTLLVTGQNDAASGIWKVNLYDNEQSLVLSATGGLEIAQAILHQGKLFYSTYQFDTDIYLLNEGKSFPLETINTPYNELHPKFIDNQSSILFISNSGGGYDLWHYKLNTDFAERITNFNARKMYPPVISSDGELVAVSFEQENKHFAVIDLTRNIQESNIQIDNQRFPLGWSEDKQTLYFSEYSDNINLFKTSRDLSKTKLIAANGGLFVNLNDAANTIVFADYVSQGIKTLSDKGEVLNFTPLNILNNLTIGEAMIKNKALYIALRGENEYNIQKINVSNGDTSYVTELPVQSHFSDIDAHGKKALYLLREASGPQGDIIKVNFKN